MSQIKEYIKMAFFNILSNKVRSLLTMLGIIIGISSVILIMSLGNGAKNMITSQLDSIGSGQISIMANSDSNLITLDDLEYIKDNVDGIQAYLFTGWAEGTISTPKGDFTTSIYGCNEDNYLFEQYSVLSKGQYFDKEDYDSGKMVCYISEYDAIRLYGNTDVIGMQIEVAVNNRIVEYTIIGLTKQSENSSLVSFEYEGAPLYLNVPLTTIETIGGVIPEDTYSASLMLADGYDSKTVCNEVIHVLESRHNCKGESAYYIESFSDYMTIINTVINVVTLFISLVAAISLLVGGVGVMNIMLVSVTERTREIGIRKSLGAKTSSIMLQFLSESAILTMLGGILGIIFGFLGAYLIAQIISIVVPSYAFTPSISIVAVLFTTLFSSAVGIFFGIYPAKKAAKLSPIEALRRM